MKRFEVGKVYQIYSRLAEKTVQAKLVKREGNYGWFKIGIFKTLHKSMKFEENYLQNFII